MERFVEVVNGKRLTIFVKLSILNVWQVLNTPLHASMVILRYVEEAMFQLADTS